MTTESTNTFDLEAFRAKREAAQSEFKLWDVQAFDIQEAYKAGERDFRYANLIYANLSNANLSNAEGVLSPIEYMEKTFEATADGYIVYKTFNGQYTAPDAWVIEPNSIISEVPNQLPTLTCGCGINVAPLKWVKREYSDEIWKCLIEWKWLVGVTVPYNTDGKIRCERVRLIEKVGR